MAHILAQIQGAWDRAVPFQIEDAQFAARNGSSVLGHKTGLGKTFIAQLAWSLWPNANKALICGTLGSLAVWSVLLQKWGGVKPVFMRGKDDPNWPTAVHATEGVYMCTYATFLLLMKRILKGKPRFPVLINDELHRVMRTRNSTWKALKRLDFDHYLGLSATWASRGPQDLFPVLNLVNHRTFSSYWRFVNTWCYVEKTNFGTDIFGVRNQDNLRKMLWSQYFRARTWPEVGNQFRRPGSNNSTEPVLRRPERVPLGDQQKKLIRDLDRDMIVCLDKEIVVTPNSLALLTRKLQMAITPKLLLPSAEWGGPIEWLSDKVIEDPHTAIFCPFREGLEIIRARLIEDGRSPDDIFILWGGLHPDEVNNIVATWKKRRGVILCTVSFAQSFALDTTDNAYSLGFSWDPNDNEQMEGRLRRLDSELQAPCNMTYVVPEGSDYEQVIYVLDGKIADTRDYLQGYTKNYIRIIRPEELPLMEEEREEDG